MRKHYIEYLRVIAMFAVVAIHICIVALSEFKNPSGWEKILYFSIRNVFHFAVPIFFMISGALILSPEKELPLNKLISRYLVKYGLVIIVFGWSFAVMEKIFVSRKFSINMVTESFMNMLSGQSWDHMWYMYSLFGAMLFVPVLRLITKYFDKSTIKYFVIVCSLFLTLIPLFNHFFGIKFGISLPFSSVYCFYMLLGYWIDNENIKIGKKLSLWLIPMLALFIVILVILQQKFMFDIDILISYSSPIIALLSIEIFSFFRNMEPILFKKETPKYIKLIGNCSFGVYIIHMFWIHIVYKLLKINPFKINALASFLVLWVIISFLSIITAVIMKKIPLLKKII